MPLGEEVDAEIRHDGFPWGRSATLAEVGIPACPFYRFTGNRVSVAGSEKNRLVELPGPSLFPAVPVCFLPLGVGGVEFSPTHRFPSRLRLCAQPI